MRDLVVTENISLDGVIDASAGWFSPAGGEVDLSEMEQALAEQREAADAFLVGRVTFEQMRSYWPTLTDDTTGITDYLDRVAKYVVSSTMTDPGWQGSTVLADLEAVRDLKATPGGDIVCTGSVRLVQSLVAADLVDEYRLFVYPTVVGRGGRLFEGASIPALDPVTVRGFPSGHALLTYRPHR